MTGTEAQAWLQRPQSRSSSTGVQIRGWQRRSNEEMICFLTGAALYNRRPQLLELKS
jgi:hypothetical protein